MANFAYEHCTETVSRAGKQSGGYLRLLSENKGSKEYSETPGALTGDY